MTTDNTPSVYSTTARDRDYQDCPNLALPYFAVAVSEDYFRSVLPDNLIVAPVNLNGCRSTEGTVLSIACGRAIANRASGIDDRTYVLLVQADCDQPVLWEAIDFAMDQRLNKLVAILQVTSSDHQILAKKWRAFDWEVRESVAGNQQQLFESLMRPSTNPVCVFIAPGG